MAKIFEPLVFYKDDIAFPVKGTCPQIVNRFYAGTVFSGFGTGSGIGSGIIATPHQNQGRE